MTIVKTWATVHFNHGKATIEATLNYEKNTFSLTHGHNDQNVTFSGDIETAMDRVKCVQAALKYIKQELFQ